MAEKIFSNTLGERIKILRKKEYSKCSCKTNTNNICSNEHKFLYQLSNMKELVSCCGVVGHRKQIMKKCLDGVIANVYRYMYSEEIETCVYTTIAVAVDNTCDVEYPMFVPTIKLSTFKHSLRQNILSEKENETEVKRNILYIYSMLDELNKQLSIHKAAQNEMEKTLSYIKTYTIYKPSTTLNIVVDDVCPICQEEMNREDSGKLYECSHAYHNKCIKEWFTNKESISCPYCRQECDFDNYFIFSKDKTC
jgi:cobalamin biosynthesis protein CbiD